MSHWQSKTKIDPADTLFSTLVRERANWHCELGFRCSRLEDFSDNKGALTCSHFEKRRKRTVRFDLDNCDAACRPCHQYVEDKAQGQKRYKAWKLEQLGEKRYNNLIIRANQSQGPIDKKMELFYVKALVKEFKEGVKKQELYGKVEKSAITPQEMAEKSSDR